MQTVTAHNMQVSRSSVVSWGLCFGLWASSSSSLEAQSLHLTPHLALHLGVEGVSPAYSLSAEDAPFSGVDAGSVLSLRYDKSAEPLRSSEDKGFLPAPRLLGADDPALEAEVVRLRASALPGGGRSSRAQGTASWVLGLLYLHGIGVTLNTADAAQWFERAYALGEPLAAAGLAWCEIDGCRNAPDPVAARRWLAPLRIVNLPRAQYLQWLIESRLSPLLITTPTLRSEPFPAGLPNRQLLLSAARAGDIQARIELGFESVSANRLVEAENYFRTSGLKSPAALTNAKMLAERLRSISPVTPITPVTPPARASANDNFVRAQRNHRGEGQSANYVEAIRLYQLAKNEGSPQAKKMLELIFSRTGADGQIDIAWMQQLAYVNFSKDVVTLDNAITQRTLRRDASPLLDLLPQPWIKYSYPVQR